MSDGLSNDELEESLAFKRGRLREAKAEIEEMREVLAKLLALQHAKYELSYLDRGIGTSTEIAVWLDVRKIVERK